MVSFCAHMATVNFRFWILNFGLGLWFAAAAQLFAADNNRLVDSWLNAQTNIQTWTADVVQTRNLKSLARPLSKEGRVWFAAPNRFRWEILSLIHISEP